PNLRFLLGVCFCPHCLEHARSMYVDVDLVRDWAARTITKVLESSKNETRETEIEDEQLRAACNGEFARYLNARLDVVTSLAEQVTAAVHAVSAATRVVFLDLSGATLGYATGRPATERTATTIAWRDGIDVAGIGRVCDGLGMLGYFADSA